MRLQKILKINGLLIAETGLRIGGSKDTIEIGGLDNPIIRHPLTDHPYIPGSSLKGKLRSLLEAVDGRLNKFKQAQTKGEPCGCGECRVCRIFGAHKNTNHNLGPARLLVRDSKLSEQSLAELLDAQQTRGVFYSEVKTENTINRDNGTANNPRPYERVPSGTSFDVEFVLKVYDIDNKEDIEKTIRQAFALLENDYLGSSGSRGYGKVRFEDLKFEEIDVNSL